MIKPVYALEKEDDFYRMSLVAIFATRELAEEFISFCPEEEFPKFEITEYKPIENLSEIIRH